MTVLMYPSFDVLGLTRSQRPINPSGKVDLSLISWNGLIVAKPAIRRPVLSISTRGDASVLAPVSLASFRVSHSAPTDKRGSRTPTNKPAADPGIEIPTARTRPALRSPNWLPT